MNIKASMSINKWCPGITGRDPGGGGGGEGEGWGGELGGKAVKKHF